MEAGKSYRHISPNWQYVSIINQKTCFPVISPFDLKNNVYNKNEAIVLSMKNGQEQVYKQLLEMEIEADRIVCKIPEGII